MNVTTLVYLVAFSQLTVKALHVRPESGRSPQECCLRVSLMPLRLNIDQVGCANAKNKQTNKIPCEVFLCCLFVFLLLFCSVFVCFIYQVAVTMINASWDCFIG